jgi:hypothetical protein
MGDLYFIGGKSVSVVTKAIFHREEALPPGEIIHVFQQAFLSEF